MSTSPTTSSSLHPIFWIAGIAVTLLSVVGIASLTGYLPSRPAAPAEPAAAVATVPAPIAVPATPPAATAPPPDAATAPEVPAPAITHHQAAKHKARSVAAAVPPPSSTGVPPDYVPPPAAAAPAAPPCANCGVVANIRQVTHEGQASGLGAVGGGVLGGALANNIGQGNGRTLATIAGMVGGGLLGNKIEKSQRQTVSYQISVRMEDGTSQLLNFETMPAWHVGDPVKVVNGSLVAR